MTDAEMQKREDKTERDTKDEPGMDADEKRILDLIKRSEEISNRLALENKKAEIILSRNIMASVGKAKLPVEEPKVETPKEYAQRMLRGQA